MRAEPALTSVAVCKTWYLGSRGRLRAIFPRMDNCGLSLLSPPPQSAKHGIFAHAGGFVHFPTHGQMRAEPAFTFA